MSRSGIDQNDDRVPACGSVGDGGCPNLGLGLTATLGGAATKVVDGREWLSRGVASAGDVVSVVEV